MWMSINASMLDEHQSFGLTAPLEKALADHYGDRMQLAVVFASGRGEEYTVTRGRTTYYGLRRDMGLCKKLWSLADAEKKWELQKPKVLQTIRDFSPDIIECFGAEWPYGAIAAEVDVPVVIHMMGFLNIYYPSLRLAISNGERHRQMMRHIGSWTSALFLKKAESSAARLERRIMAANRYFMGRTDWDRLIVQYYSPGAVYYHVPEAIRPEIYAAAGQWRYHFGGEKLRLLTVTQSDARKGNEIILQTARLLRELLGLDFTWRVTGNKETYAPFERRTGIRHEDVNVTLLGRIEPTEVIEELRQADLFIHPSLIDNSPNSVCEAQLIGCPVIASNVGGVPQLVRHGETGFLYPYNEPHTLAFLIGNLYRSKELLTQISQNEVSLACRRHDPKAVADAVFAAYEAIIASDRQRRSADARR